MHLKPLINKKTAWRNLKIRKAHKQEMKITGRGSGKPLKNYLGKIVSLSSSLLIGEEPRVRMPITDTSAEDLLTALENAELRGMSGNKFPVHKKIDNFLLSNSEKRILLINAVECDPALIHDEWLLVNRYIEVVNAIKNLTQTLSLDKVVLATKNKNIKANRNFSLSIVPPRYPMGEEHFLIQQVLGIFLENTEIPAKHGILVLNLQSVYQIGKIISQCYDGGRFITVADLTEASARIAYVYPTDSISAILMKGFGKANNKSMYRGNGIMGCIAASEADTFSNHENFAAYANVPEIDNKNKCRRCGSCNRKCPVKIKVAKIVSSIDGNKNTDHAKYNYQQCIKCGSCTYFCPASKNVSSYIIELLDKK